MRGRARHECRYGPVRAKAQTCGEGGGGRLAYGPNRACKALLRGHEREKVLLVLAADDLGDDGVEEGGVHLLAEAGDDGGFDAVD